MEALASSSSSPVLLPCRSGWRRWRHQQQQKQRCLGFPSTTVTSIFSSPFRAPHPSSISVSTSNGLVWSIRALPAPADGGSDGEEEGEEEEVGTKKEEEGGEEVVERALGMDGSIPGSADELVRRVSSRAYDLRRRLKQSMDSSSYDVLESNPWREHPKPVYVLTHRENMLCTMKTRRNHSEVEKELGLLFSKGGSRKSDAGKRSKQASTGTQFHMFVEDIREGILVFEDEHDAEKYCDLLQGGQGCEGIAEIEASSVFDICHKMRALAVLFRRGRTLPLPETLELNLKARNRSLEDQ